jgi:hypothetical protein
LIFIEERRGEERRGEERRGEERKACSRMAHTPTNSVAGKLLTRWIRYAIDQALILCLPSLVDGDASFLYF